jgi:hypothetical protein
MTSRQSVKLPWTSRGFRVRPGQVGTRRRHEPECYIPWLCSIATQMDLQSEHSS